MSRIDEALRLASEIQKPASQASTPSGDAFHSPWRFSGAETVDTERPPENGGWDSRSARRLGAGSADLVNGFSANWAERLVVSPDADALLVEQFRKLGATLHQTQAVNQTKTVMVTSASPGDGKTLTSINLALILSESYKRSVLLVDADLRRPSIRDVSHMPNVVGLSDGLRARTEQKLTVLPLTRTLTLLPAGRPDPDPMGSLTSVRMRRILDDAASRFDWVIIDAPPVGTVADASLLAAMVDVALLVVRVKQTRYPIVKRAVDALGPDKILGVVLNGVEDLDIGEYGAYYAQSLTPVEPEQ